jgi:hypothetical protein
MSSFIYPTGDRNNAAIVEGERYLGVIDLEKSTVLICRFGHLAKTLIEVRAQGYGGCRRRCSRWGVRCHPGR